MRSQKGMGHLMLIICIAIIILLVLGVGYILKEKIEEEKLETYQTDMLLIQGKVKVFSQEATIQKNEEFLKGRNITESLEEEQIKNLLENNVISQEETSFSKYYILEQSHLDEIGLSNIKLEEGYFIVNYDTDEIIYSNGITIGDKTFYKLSELKEINTQEENEEQKEEQNEEQVVNETIE